MTTIIAKVTDKGVDLGSDSQSTAGNTIRHATKVVNVNGQFWVGTAGRARFGDIVEFADVPHIHPAELSGPGFDAKGWLVTQVIPAWIESVKNAEQVHHEKDEWPHGSSLVVLAGRVFEISSDFSVDEILDYGGIGSGSDYAVGAMAAGKGLKDALEIAARLDPYTGGELKVMKGLK